MNRAKREARIREARRPKSPKEIEVESKNTKLRVILLIASITVAVICIGMGIYAALETEPGWQRVEVTSEGLHCGNEFVFQYYFGATDMDPTDEEKAVSALYSQAMPKAWKLFQEDVTGLEPGKTVKVDPALYAALELIQEKQCRNVFLAPVYDEYDRIFLCESDEEAGRYDPAKDPELAQYHAQIAAFAADPESVDIVLLENNSVKLTVSQAYLDFAGEYEITCFVDLGWMRNAFIADYLAQTLAEAGHTHGYLASYDGFTRNLDGSQSYMQNIMDRDGTDVNLPAAMEYTGPMSIVSLRDYPMGQQDRWHYYSYADGETVTAFADPVDGLERTATDNLLSYSAERSCAQILLELAPVFVAEELDTQALQQLSAEGIQSIWFEGMVLHRTDKTVKLVVNSDEHAAKYSIH